MDRAQQHWLTRSFRDETLERAFREDFARRSRAHFRVIVSAALLLWLTVLPMDYEIGGTDANGRALVLARLIAAGLFLPAVAVAFAPWRIYHRWWQVVGAFSLTALLGGVAIMPWVVPEPGLYEANITAAGFIVVVTTGYAGAAMRPVVVVVPSLATSALLGGALFAQSEHAPTLVLFIVLANVMGILAGYLLDHYRREGFLYARDAERERARSDALLHDVLPAAIAERLKEARGPIAESYDRATVVFADLVGFTAMSEQVPATELVGALDALFSDLDALVRAHGLEKIKTVGDQYMAVAGVPEAVDDHADRALAFAVAMRERVTRHDWGAGRRLSVRIGLHSGPVVAGVIGDHKLVFDVWGDTVNTASRMESSAPDGAIQLSDATAALVSDRAALELRGPVEVKSKGTMTTYLAQPGPRSDAVVS